jgi:flagellar FliJ protein
LRRFQFRLESLLELRTHREREWLAKLAEAAGQCSRLVRHIHDNAEATSGAFRAGPAGPGPLDLRLMYYREHYLVRLSAEKRALQASLRESLRRKDEVQKKYLEVSRDKKVLDKLKERRQGEHYRRERIEEFKVQDDLNSSQFIREKRGAQG